MLKMIYNSLTDRQNADYPQDLGQDPSDEPAHEPDHDSGNNPGTRSLRDIVRTDLPVGSESAQSPTTSAETTIAVVGGHAQSNHVGDQVSHIGTNREKLREIRDWHLSKAQMSWSLETQQRHQQFVTWLEEAIAALDSRL